MPAVVTGFPCASRTCTAGWVVKARPLAAPAGGVVIVSSPAAPDVRMIPEWAGVSVPDENVREYGPLSPVMLRPLKVATPPVVVTIVVPLRVAPVPMSDTITETPS
jgi:hypothetical protein